jgi:serine/threonine-protein kinase RsbT
METTVPIQSDSDIVMARQQGHTFMLRLGFSSPDARLVATAISELARNIVLYATHGEIVLRPIDRDGRAGVLVIARDHGPGIPVNVQAAANGSNVDAGTPLGLRGLRRLVDECEIESRLGHGTTVALRKWK